MDTTLLIQTAMVARTTTSSRLRRRNTRWLPRCDPETCRSSRTKQVCPMCSSRTAGPLEASLPLSVATSSSKCYHLCARAASTQTLAAISTVTIKAVAHSSSRCREVSVMTAASSRSLFRTRYHSVIQIRSPTKWKASALSWRKEAVVSSSDEAPPSVELIRIHVPAQPQSLSMQMWLALDSQFGARSVAL